MPPDDRADSGGEGTNVKRAGYPEGANQVISSCARFQLIEKPKSLLGEGSRKSHWAHLCSLKRFLLPGGGQKSVAAHSMSMDEKRLVSFPSALSGQSSCHTIRMAFSSSWLSVFTQID